MEVSALRRLVALTVLCLTATELSAAELVKLERRIDADFGYVEGLDSRGDGTLLVVDSGKGALLTIGAITEKRALEGGGGLFASRRPQAVAVVEGDHVAIAFGGVGKIAVVDGAGNTSVEFGEGGREAGRLEEPKAIAYSANHRLYVADNNNDRIVIYGPNGVFLRNLIGSGKQRLESPIQVDVDRQERVYVLGRDAGGTVTVLDEDGTVLRQFTAEQLAQTTGTARARLTALAVDAETGLLFLGDSDGGRVYGYDWERERVLVSFGTKGSQAGQFGDIAALEPLPERRLAVADNVNKKIEVYQLPPVSSTPLAYRPLPTATLAATHAAKCDTAYRHDDGSGWWCFSDKHAVLHRASGASLQLEPPEDPVAAAMGDGRVAVIAGKRLELFDSDGRRYFSSGANTARNNSPIDFGGGYDVDTDGKFDQPADVYLRHDRVYVADRRNRRIQIHTADGLYLDKIASPKTGDWRFDEPVAVAVDSRERVYVADRKQRRVFVFTKDKRLLHTIDGGGPTLEFTDLYDLDVDRDDQLYVLGATADNRAVVQVFRDDEARFSFGARSSDPAGFDEAVSLSVARTSPTIIAVFDRDKQHLMEFEYRQVPRQVAGLQSVGHDTGVDLFWQPLGSRYVDAYRVYGADDAHGPFRLLTRAVDSTARLRDDQRTRWYRVSALSDFGLEGLASDPTEDRFLTASQHFEAGRYAEAIRILTELHQENGDHADTLRLLGEALLQQGNHAAARGYFEQLAILPEHEIEGLRLGVAALRAGGDLIGARQLLNRLLQTGQPDTATLLACGEVNVALNEPIGAVECLEQALAADPQNARARLLMARAFIALDVLDSGRAQLDQARQLAPEDPTVWAESGRIEQTLGDHEQAIVLFERAANLDLADLDSRRAMAKSLLALERYDEVRHLAAELTQHAETAGEGHYLLGLTSLAAARHGEALIALSRATREAPGHARAWLALAETYAAMEKPDRVLEPLEKAWQAAPDDYDVSRRLGEHYADIGRHAAAAQAFSRAAEVRPDDFAVSLKLAEAQLRAGQFQAAATTAVTAHRLDGQQTGPLQIAAEATAKQGKYGAAVGYLKQALERDAGSFELHLRLGALYVDSNQFDLARATLEKAALLDNSRAEPHALLGRLFLKRRLFEEAIAALDRAVGMDPSADNRLLLDEVYAEQKKTLEFASNAPQVLLKDLQLQPVFSAAYKQYADAPVGRIRVENIGNAEYRNLALTFTIKGYMDFPSSVEIPLLKPNSAEQLELHAAFNNRILEIDEDTGVQVEVALKFVRDGRDDAVTLTQPMTIYGKNAILWSQPNMVGAFVTPKDDTLRDFVRATVNAYRPERNLLNDKVVAAVTLFSALAADGVKYIADPNAPYSRLAADQVDYVQFARETLKIRSGDCDDLSVLFSAALENLGIETAILDVPGHLLLMFNTGLPAERANAISTDPELLAIHNGQVWIPLEVTMVATSFAEAWTEGARKYHDHATAGTLNIVALRDAWEQYRPVTLKPAGYELPLPPREAVLPRLDHAYNMLLERSLERLVLPYRTILELAPGSRTAKMEMAFIYGRNGLLDKAFALLDELIVYDPQDGAARNNRGNLHLIRGDFGRALRDYLEAERIDGEDARIKVNIAMAYYQGNDLDSARRKYAEAVAIDEAVTTEYGSFAKLLGS